ncbi:MAG: alpha/beta fold hydrolase, partial [Planctomycetes bacterium]|nr:alpha/beta fold hydrolase [Planctomycetota bacterium]
AVLLHGFPLDHRMWLDVMHGELSRQRTLCAIDLRGHGQSPWCGDPVHTMELLADDVAQVIRALGDEPADVCGLSMGGYVAFALHERHRDHVRSLVLSNTRPAGDTAAQRQGRAAAIETVADQGRGAIVAGMLPKLLAPDADPLHRAQLRTMIEAQPAETIVADQRGLQQRPDRTAALADFAVPTLVVAGELDAITPLAEAEQWAPKIPNARLEVIAGTGHMSPLEHAAAWSSAVAKFW